jgi:medium-chain acyl-[acyl-carrier-protein] hydrolase
MSTPSGPAVAGRGSKWLVCPKPNPSAAVQLVCFASAGHGPSMFRSWAPLLPPSIELSIAQLAGRESRWSEPPATSIAEVVTPLVEAMQSALNRPFALLGHSLGGLLAFETTCALRAVGRTPEHLFVSAHRAPQLPNRYPRISAHDDAEFLINVNARHGGVPPEVAANRELMALMLPGLKADYRMFEDYGYVERGALECPITALGGTDDRYIDQSELEHWRVQTTAAFNLRIFPGGHFFVNDLRPQVVASVVEALARAAS